MVLQRPLAFPVIIRGTTSLRISHRSQLVFAEMAVSLQRSGKTVRGFLNELYQTYGYFQVKDNTAKFFSGS